MPKVAKREPYMSKEEFIEKYGLAMRQCNVAELIDFSRSAVCVMCKDGRLQTNQDGLVLIDSLYDYLYTPRLRRLAR